MTIVDGLNEKRLLACDGGRQLKTTTKKKQNKTKQNKRKQKRKMEKEAAA